MNAVHIIEKLKNHQPSILGKKYFRKSAVLLPLIEINNETHLLFEIRSMKLRHQPGDICFPGGRKDKTDKNIEQCAIRETSEELGIEPTEIHDIIPLDYVLSDLNSIIYPFVGRISKKAKIQPNKSEVEDIFTVPLAFFLNTKPKIFKVNLEVVPEENFPFDLITGGKNYQWRTTHVDELFYQYEEKVIWGLTAKIVHHFIELLK